MGIVKCPTWVVGMSHGHPVGSEVEMDMKRRRFVKYGGSIATLGLFGTQPVLANNNSNQRRSEANLVDLSPGDVVEQTSDPDASNFEEEFPFWRVDHGITYDTAKYREPVRTGPGVVELGGSSGSYWFGVSAPDSEGIQHRIVHTGQTSLYLKESDTDEWKELRLQFDGQGNLLNVNGVSPQ